MINIREESFTMVGFGLPRLDMTVTVCKFPQLNFLLGLPCKIKLFLLL
jgi:hypothetical protein